MNVVDATNLHRKSGVRGPNKMAKPTIAFSPIIAASRVKAFEKYHFRPTYAGANVGHPSSLLLDLLN